MTGTIDRTPCPQCGFVKDDRPVSRTGLYIDIEFVAKPIGDFSLAGMQIKVSGRELPVLKCRNCPFKLVGEFDGDNHAVFSPPKGAGSDTPDPTDAPTA